MISGSISTYVERSFSQADLDRFAALSGDHNPIHVDPEFAARTRFGRTVAHGLLLNTVLRGLLETLAPGARQIFQELMFPAPSLVGESLRFTASIIEQTDSEASIRLCVERSADGTVTCQGQTRMRVGSRT